ncbi:MAG: AmmeMemoRadiSam system radical SAM enzyme [Planctomycetes bacterium]|nr:AmmeMemoRadiSam system radical SAM enzyme [Planctomycetota bacterium]
MVLKESLLYERLPGRKVRCNVCLVRCLISPEGRGFCSTRRNRDGTLYTLIYGKTSGVCIDPIEKKPLFHFNPGTQILSMGTRGCNFKCPGCQNWEISHDKPDLDGENLEDCPPAESVRLALRHGAQGICWTYNDPSIWLEQTLETAVLAKEKELYTAYVTNGYATPEQVDTIGPYLDAYRVDLKGADRASYQKIAGLKVDWLAILDGTRRAKEKWGMHVECVTNVTPTINDSDEVLRQIARWIVEYLGRDTAWHVTRFYPYLKYDHLPPTPVSTIERAAEIGRGEGLQFVYVGNLPGHHGEDTVCPGCGKTLLRRHGFAVTEAHLTPAGHCAFCDRAIPGRWGTIVGRTSGVRRPLRV